jgi:hypothetical protein
MNRYILLVALIIVVLYTCTRSESFTETFGLSGYTKPVDVVKLNDPKPDLTAYKQIESVLDNDKMEAFVLKANAEIMKRTGISTYIIETTAVKAYRREDTQTELYECMFMAMKKGGFSFGFSIVASFEVKKDGTIRLVSLRSQPLTVDSPSTVKPFVDGSEGKMFVDYDLVNIAAMPKRGEFQFAKNKLQ